MCVERVSSPAMRILARLKRQRDGTLRPFFPERLDLSFTDAKSEIVVRQ